MNQEPAMPVPAEKSDDQPVSSRFHAIIPSLIGACILLLVVGAQCRLVVHQNEGHFVYPLDDTYIHLSIARNLVQHHVWGVTPYQFSSASSSPGWTLLLACAMRICGVHLLLPLFLNLIFAVLFLVLADRIICRWFAATPIWYRLLLQVGMIFCVSLPNLVLIGMEHTAQTFFVTAMAALSAEVLSTAKDRPLSTSVMIGWLAAAFFACALRYETVFVVLPVLLGLLWRRRLRAAALFAIFSGLPPLLFALFSMLHSPFWLPYSVLAKAAINYGVDGGSLLHLWYSLTGPTLRPILILSAAIFLARFSAHGLWEKTQTFLALFLFVCIEQMALAPSGWLMRYESYLFGFGLLSCGLAGADFVSHVRKHHLLTQQRTLAYSAVGLLAAGAVLPSFAYRAYHGLKEPVQATHDRYLEHIQMARFISDYYDHDVIVVNDIGAISYYSHAKILDLVGLGSEEPLLAMHGHGKFMSSKELDQWAQSQGARVAILQTDWDVVQRVLPGNWIFIGAWHLPRNVAFNSRTVGFYAIDPQYANTLRENFNAFPLSPEVVRIRPKTP
ncbi:MAG TPA: hypothetical protein VHX63_08015 [Acidobacteriaceae bacterium]|jgi:hypothetical protein|nr:hypothetical protein [Acidobacteriaceae bacterium]